MKIRSTLKNWFGEGIIELLVNGGIALGLVSGGMIGYAVYTYYHIGLIVSIIAGIGSGIGFGTPVVMFGGYLNEKWFGSKQQKEMSG